ASRNRSSTNRKPLPASLQHRPTQTNSRFSFGNSTVARKAKRFAQIRETGFTPGHAACHLNETNAINQGEGEAVEWGEIFCEFQQSGSRKHAADRPSEEKL